MYALGLIPFAHPLINFYSRKLFLYMISIKHAGRVKIYSEKIKEERGNKIHKSFQKKLILEMAN
jgi:hypothetical protein